MRYHFLVAAVCVSGGAFFAPASWVGSVSATPSVPNSLGIQAGVGQVVITWKTTASTAAYSYNIFRNTTSSTSPFPAAGYCYVQAGAASNSSTVTVAPFNSNSPSYLCNVPVSGTVSGDYLTLNDTYQLTAGTTYYYFISVVGSGSGATVASNAVYIGSATPLYPTGTTTPTLNFQAAAGTNTIGLSWTAVPAATGFTVQYYLFRQASGGSPSLPTTGNTSTSTNTYMATGASGSAGYTDTGSVKPVGESSAALVAGTTYNYALATVITNSNVSVVGNGANGAYYFGSGYSTGAPYGQSFVSPLASVPAAYQSTGIPATASGIISTPTSYSFSVSGGVQPKSTATNTAMNVTVQATGDAAGTTAAAANDYYTMTLTLNTMSGTTGAFGSSSTGYVNSTTLTVTNYLSTGSAVPFTIYITTSGTYTLTAGSVSYGTSSPASTALSAPTNGSNVSSQFSVIAAPTVAVTPNDTYTNAATIPFTMTFNEAVTGLTTGGITVTNGALGTLTGSGTIWTVVVTPITSGTPVTLQVNAGAAQNSNSTGNLVSNTASVNWSTTAPTVAVTPNGTSVTGTSVTFTMTFSETVTGLTSGGITVTNGSLGTLGGSGTTWTISVTPPGSGTVTLQVNAGAAQDVYGNYNTASNTASVTFLATQTITFSPTTTLITTATPLVLSATTTSNLAITFTVTSGSGNFGGASSIVGTLSGGVSTATLTATAAGSNIVVTASQAGNSSYSAATPVPATIYSAVPPAAISFNPPTSGTLNIVTGTSTWVGETYNNNPDNLHGNTTAGITVGSGYWWGDTSASSASSYAANHGLAPVSQYWLGPIASCTQNGPGYPPGPGSTWAYISQFYYSAPLLQGYTYTFTSTNVSTASSSPSGSVETKRQVLALYSGGIGSSNSQVAFSQNNSASSTGYIAGAKALNLTYTVPITTNFGASAGTYWLAVGVSDAAYYYYYNLAVTVVAPGSTTTSITGPSGVTPGTPVTITTTVTSLTTTSAPTGTMTLTDTTTGTVYGPTALTASATTATQSTATFTVTPAGADVLSASYSPTGSFQASAATYTLAIYATLSPVTLNNYSGQITSGNLGGSTSVWWGNPSNNTSGNSSLQGVLPKAAWLGPTSYSASNEYIDSSIDASPQDSTIGNPDPWEYTWQDWYSIQLTQGVAYTFTVTYTGSTKTADSPSYLITSLAPGSLTPGSNTAGVNGTQAAYCSYYTAAVNPATAGSSTFTLNSNGTTATAVIVYTPSATGNFLFVVTDYYQGSNLGYQYTLAVTTPTGVASQLVYTTPPPTALSAGTAFAAKVSVADQFGNVLTSDTGGYNIALSITGATLNGTTSMTDTAGVAAFSGLSIDTAGSYTITASAGSLTAATAPINVTAAAATKLVFTTPPPATISAGAPFAATVSVQDKYGDVLTANNGTYTVKLAIAGGTLVGTTAMTDTAGVAAFNGLSITSSGSFTLTATATSLISTSGAVGLTPATATIAVAPSVTGIATFPVTTPAVGPLTGGTTVTITGVGFANATSVSFGGAALAAGQFTINSNTSITATSPSASAAGPVNVTVTAGGLTSSYGTSDQFIYELYFNYAWTTWNSLNWSTPTGSTITWNSLSIPVVFNLSNGFYSWYAPANAQTVNPANGAISGTAWGINNVAPYPWISSSLTTNIAGSPGMDGPYANNDPAGNTGSILTGDWKDFATGQLSYYGPYSNATAWQNPVFWSYYNILVTQNQLQSQYQVTATTTTVTNSSGLQYFLVADGQPNSPLGRTSYIGNSGMYYFNTDSTNPVNTQFSNGPLFQDSHTKLTDITDGTSNTLLFGESLGGPNNALPTYQLTWMGSGTMPSYWDCQTPSQYFMFSSMHPGVVNFAFCDGSVRSVTTVTASVPPDSMGTQTGANQGDGTNTNSDKAMPPAASNPATPRWVAFQQLAGISDNASPNLALLGLTP